MEKVTFKPDDKVVVGMIWNSGHIFKMKGKIQNIIKTEDEQVYFVVNGECHKSDNVYHEDEWDKLTDKQYGKD